MANQGGSHEQHVKSGQQSQKNKDMQADSAKTTSSSDKHRGTQGGTHEQHVRAGQQSHKNSH